MNRNLIKFFAVVGILSLGALFLAVFITAHTGIVELMRTTFWAVVCHLVLIVADVAVFFGALIGSILVLTNREAK